MKNVIVGTAGHVDHGKTWLIKALTGTDTDRLEEEKKRGITIDLGFAQLKNDLGLDIGIIDVPGHEKFIKNMLAGAQGIDIVLLVVAADEGIMPQTIEHFEIVKNLGIKHGILVITKCDAVDEMALNKVKKEVKNYLSETFFSDEDLYTVSSKTGENIDKLKEAIINKAFRIDDKAKGTPFRMPVDRVFTISGFGTVVTGTTIEGSINKGDEIIIYPSLLKTKVRSIQVHDIETVSASAGQRTALNLNGISKDEINRGDVLSVKGNLENSMILDVKVTLFKDTSRKLRNNDRVHLYLGSKELVAKTVLIGKNEISAGESAYVQLRLEENIAVKRNDPFIIRFYSPLESFGGGTVINPDPKKHKRNNHAVLKSISGLDLGELNQQIVALADLNDGITPISYIKRILNTDIINCPKVFKLNEQYIISEKNLEKQFKLIEKIFNEHYKADKLTLGIKPNELKTKVKYVGDYNVTEELIKLLTEQNKLVLSDGYLNLKSHEPDFSDYERKLIEKIMNEYEKMGLVLKSLDNVDRKKYIEYLVSKSELIVLDKNIYVTKVNFNRAIEMFKELSKKGGVSLPDFRDYLNTSRKSALLLLDAFDEMKITEKIDNLRYLM